MAWMSHTPGQTGPEPVAPQPSADVRQRMAWHERRRSLPNLHWRVSERMRPNQHAPSRQAARGTVKAALARPIQSIALASASSLDRLCRSCRQIRASSFRATSSQAASSAHRASSTASLSSGCCSHIVERHTGGYGITPPEPPVLLPPLSASAPPVSKPLAAPTGRLLLRSLGRSRPARSCPR